MFDDIRYFEAKTFYGALFNRLFEQAKASPEGKDAFINSMEDFLVDGLDKGD